MVATLCHPPDLTPADVLHVVITYPALRVPKQLLLFCVWMCFSFLPPSLSHLSPHRVSPLLYLAIPPPAVWSTDSFFFRFGVQCLADCFPTPLSLSLYIVPFLFLSSMGSLCLQLLAMFVCDFGILFWHDGQLSANTVYLISLLLRLNVELSLSYHVVETCSVLSIPYWLLCNWPAD